MEEHQGGCLCGQLRYITKGAPDRAAVCHCRYCQLRSGSAFGNLVYFADDQIEIVAGELKDFHFTSESGYAWQTAIMHVSGDRIEPIAFAAQRFHVLKLEISEFDQVLLSEIEDVSDTTGEFWDEVGGRIANTMKQAVLFLQEQQDFPPFPQVHVVADALRAENFIQLIDRHFSLAPVRLWDPTKTAEMSPPVQNLVSQFANRSGFILALGLGLRRLGTFGKDGPGLKQLSMLPQALYQ